MNAPGIRHGLLTLLLPCLLMAGCSSLQRPSDPADAARPAALSTTYAGSLALIESGDYRQAAQMLESLLRAGTPPDERNRALLALAFTQLQLGRPERALQLSAATLNQPGSLAQPDYALYLHAAALLASEPAPTASQVRRASDDLKRLQREYPGSRYAGATREQLAEIEQRLADNELRTARELLERGQYAAALNRCRYLIEHYPHSAAMAGTLDTMATAYRRLGLDALADSTETMRRDVQP
ncbi:MAG: outer membrane protein assembly factor BamD [Oceanospirillaceae bacterium]|nr:outer membrane protein assembly factor BamD [Oceanospirillaceae bacterium]